jgi:hypothetical protein
MPKNISKELEKEILGLTQKEKDRHLLRLIAANKLLREQLQFTLLEDDSELRLRVEELEEGIRENLSKDFSHVTFLTKAIRKEVAAVTWHRRVTKDKYGEIHLWIVLFQTVFEHQSAHIRSFERKADVLRVYLVKRMAAVLRLLNAVHADFQTDFFVEINKILKLLHTFDTKFEAVKIKLPTSVDS